MDQLLDPQKTKVSLATAAAVIFAIGGIVWWAADLSATVRQTGKVVEAIPGIEEQLAAINTALNLPKADLGSTAVNKP